MENAERAQERLAARGFKITPDGDFGPKSFAALMTFIAGKRQVTPLRDALGTAAAKHFVTVDIDRPLRVAHALAQQCVETGGFSQLVENLNYSIAGLRTTFNASRISDADRRRLGRRDDERSLPLDRQEAIANIVYGGPFGLRNLGNRNPGDGWKYRGRGAKQTTGFSNYDEVRQLTGVDVVLDPVKLEDPDLGMRAAGIFWENRGCNRFADRDDPDRLTAAINGGDNGIKERKAALARAKMILL